jgi:peptide/nickel transport system substrate-binding protein
MEVDMKGRSGVLAGLLILALALVSCGGGQKAGTAGTVEFSDTLNVCVTQESPSLDLHKNSTLIARQIGAGTIWEKLLTLNAESDAVPELAERFEMTDNAHTYTFYLRKGVKFHDGQIMDADDVVASMNRWINGFSTAKAMAGDSRFVKIDETSVRITFDHPAVTFADVVAGAAQPAIITTVEACGDEDDKGMMKQYVGTGPFKFAEWKLGQYVLLDRFADYVPYGDSTKPLDGWAGYKAPKIEHLYYWYAPEAATRFAGLQTDQFDVNYNVSGDDYTQHAALPNVEMVSFQAGTVAYIFNHKQGVAANLYFRQAVNAAINVPDILRASHGDLQELGSCYMDDTQPFWKTDAGSEYYNVNNSDLAKELLAKAGYKGEKFTMLVAPTSNMDRAALVMQQQLQAVGINTEVTVVDWATLIAHRNDPARFDLYSTTYASVPVPSLKLYYGPTYPGWSDDPTLQQYMADFNAATSRDEARQRWDVLQAYSWEYLPLISMGHYIAASAWSSRVENVTAFNGLYFWNTTVRK